MLILIFKSNCRHITFAFAEVRMDACCNIPLNRTLFEKMLRYQRVNRKPLLEEEETTQWQKLTKRQSRVNMTLRKNRRLSNRNPLKKEVNSSA